MTEQPSVARFTPGPWRLQEFPSREVTLKRRHWAVGQVKAPARGVGLAFGETDANARLIAAAPELYEALIDASRRLAHIAATCGLPNAIEACRLNVREAQTARDAIDAALAKAVPQTVAGDDATTPNTDPQPNQTVGMEKRK